VHGANRLGSNSLIDLVVFGRAAALRCAELIKKDSAIPELPKGAGEGAIERLEQNASILFPGAAAAIRRAAALMPLAIASGALGVEIRRVLDREGLTSCFKAIVAAEDTPVSKPAADPYRRALALLAEAVGAPFLPAECVAVEDSPWGLESAQAAGLHTVAVAHTYDRGALDADLVISSLDELDVATIARLCAA